MEFPLQHKTSISFSSGDLDLFSKASHDRNPLHLSEDYARKTPFAQRVVFGVLGGLSCLKYLQDRADFQLKKIFLEFLGPLFINQFYSLEITESSQEQVTARIFDGRRLMLKMKVNFRPGNSPTIQAVSAQASRTEAVMLSPSELTRGIKLDEATYCPNLEALRILAYQLSLPEKGVGEVEIATLLWASYFVGMELPGFQALFSKLTLSFENSLPNLKKPFSYTSSLTYFDDRYNLLRTKAELSDNGKSFATGEIQSFIRPTSTISTSQYLETLLPSSEFLKGKVALVTGASRGLGAAIAQSLALQGCTVLANFLRSYPEAKSLQKALENAPGQVILMQGNAAELSWCLSAKQEIISRYGKLDFLICNACPAILPLWLEPTAVDRVNEYVAQSLALMSVPMSTFLSLVSESLGWNIVISSIYASQAFPADLPHYVIAKSAIEGLTKVAASEYKDINFAIVRPPKLLTDQTNTPIGRQNAISVEKVAVSITEHLRNVSNKTQIDILENIWEID
ncbi:3-oxoacyl-[acyl-carrier-protein] reductase [Halomicronema hongdechloris C2206]|uniref:3-oxoacyl-[acyl-carrier-protein] reductase n=1 Tax=Halomicronema hongdechloris C2206 TaxID=1641165 RepID=A0A1Z3HJF4_9CYAN|nr:SDR family NAD(P)-dependent oxidoreductase [Halomicronema hongdechloris]ASC70431.1 3-oxoacyl-[acyl-carrier-protein] reductase [Halomicronema hongdechloris C2206]